MILDLFQIRDIIVNNPNKDLIAKGIEYSKLLRMHMYGEGLDQHMKVIDTFEKPDLRNLRVKYTKSNKDLFSRLGRPIDKIFSARGGSVYYNLPESIEKQVRNLVADVRDGFSVREWIESFWRPHMLDDPFGLIFMEVLPQPDAIRNKRAGKPITYPVYIAIGNVYDYLPKGAMLEYVVFKLDNADKVKMGFKDTDQIFRVVDDSMDYIVQREDDNVYVRDQIPNYFLRVPGIINSDLVDPKKENCVLSLFDDAIELADQFLLKRSVKAISDFRHGFPKYAEFASDCDNCGGSGLVDGGQCPECKGTGKKAMIKPSDIKLLNWPEGDVKGPVITPAEVGAYISPDKTFYEIATADIRDLENLSNITLWGMQTNVQTQGTSIDKNGQAQTATEIMADMKPQEDRLHPISKMAEKRHKFIIDSVIKIQFSKQYQNYEDSSVNYGRRYMLENPDAIWEKYSDARIKGSPINVLDDLLQEYYEAKYASDPVALAISMKLMYVEPFVHYKIGEVQAFMTSDEDYKAKLYFGEWLALQNDGALLSKTVQLLKEDLAAFAGAKQLKPPDPIKQVA